MYLDCVSIVLVISILWNIPGGTLLRNLKCSIRLHTGSVGYSACNALYWSNNYGR